MGSAKKACIAVRSAGLFSLKIKNKKPKKTEVVKQCNIPGKRYKIQRSKSHS